MLLWRLYGNERFAHGAAPQCCSCRVALIPNAGGSDRAESFPIVVPSVKRRIMCKRLNKGQERWSEASRQRSRGTSRVMTPKQVQRAEARFSSDVPKKSQNPYTSPDDNNCAARDHDCQAVAASRKPQRERKASPVHDDTTIGLTPEAVPYQPSRCTILVNHCCKNALISCR